MTPGPETLEAIKAFVTGDPGYAGLDVEQVTDLLNKKRPQSPPAYRAAPYAKGAFMMAVVPAIMALSGAPSQVQARWMPALDLLKASPDDSMLDVTSDMVRTLLAGLTADGLLSSEASTAILTAGRVEVLKADASRFGYAHLSKTDVAVALSS